MIEGGILKSIYVKLQNPSTSESEVLGSRVQRKKILRISSDFRDFHVYIENRKNSQTPLSDVSLPQVYI